MIVLLLLSFQTYLKLFNVKSFWSNVIQFAPKKIFQNNKQESQYFLDVCALQRQRSSKKLAVKKILEICFLDKCAKCIWQICVMLSRTVNI